MTSVCLYFQLHQPWRLRRYSLFDISLDHSYFSQEEENTVNQQIFTKVAEKSYWPMLRLLKKLTQRHPEFRFAISLSGVWLEQAQKFDSKLVTLIRQLVKTGQVEILSETYYHSLASLFSPAEFRQQIELHDQLIEKLFSVKPTIFRNTELIFSNDIAAQIQQLGFAGMLAEGADRILQGRKPTAPYTSPSAPRLPILLKHYQLSDDIAFRFSQQSWPHWPLTVSQYAHWITAPHSKNEVVNLFMDFETFGEHQWADTGIFTFFEALIAELEQHGVQCITPTQAVQRFPVSDHFDAPGPVSWADVDRDVTAWLGNPLQQDAARALYALESAVLSSHSDDLIQDWRRLQTSDHFYYMCTKWANDGDVHAYFSPYDSPLEAYRNFSLVLADFTSRVIA